ncbi:MAG: FAD-dependent oxidoreductase [Christensenellaceae bacterium]|jgi:uncharacterized FAD-dependent dehydrogenase|nr:FAD-dependent oxidoreductase [Christensenellaceae bacterium]
MVYDLIIVGAGPAGIFTALELIERGGSPRILMVEKGEPLERRACPKGSTRDCVHCRPNCHITTGFSGAGAFSDGKLSLSHEVGGDLPDLLGVDEAQRLIDYTDRIYLRFGADQKVEGLENNEEIKEIRRRAIVSGLKLVDCPIRHLGTELAREVYLKIQVFLKENGVEMRFLTDCLDLIVEEGRCRGVKIQSALGGEKQAVFARNVVLSVGRRGADWLEGLCRRHSVAREAGVVDIGVRVEVRNEVMERVNNVLYESKLIGYPKPFENKVRTFCQNPGGFVSQENYEGDLAVVNGHSYKHQKSENTNLAILCSHHFQAPFDDPTAFAQKVAQLTNLLGAGKILVQRYGDILSGRRSWPDDLARTNVRPSMPDAVPGDIGSALPYRTLTNILAFIRAVDTIVPGFAGEETLLYAPEVKFYSNRVLLDAELNSSLPGLYCLGDASGWTRGLMMASAMGVRLGQKLARAAAKE